MFNFGNGSIDYNLDNKIQGAPSYNWKNCGRWALLFFIIVMGAHIIGIKQLVPFEYAQSQTLEYNLEFTR